MSVRSQAIRIAAHLSKRQREIIGMMADGETTKGIALALKISEKTVEYHRMQLMQRVGLFNYAQLTKLAVRLGLSELDV